VANGMTEKVVSASPLRGNGEWEEGGGFKDELS